MAILERVDGPDDLKRLSFHELYRLAAELRDLIIRTVSRNGGHLASSLGAVELTLALHRVFSTPDDAIVWDVGHQSYAHKIVTGRRELFGSIRTAGGLSGFPKRSESPHDAFDAGHASTSISAALGILAARKALGLGGRAIAVIGDGALTGGMAYEALSHAGQLGLPLVVVLNDNSMSISPNVGAVSRYLSRLTATVRYQRFRNAVDRAILMVPVLGRPTLAMVVRAKRSIKALFFKENLFSDLGFEYAGPIDGHNLPMLCHVLGEVRRLDKPVVVHVVTTKGKGHEPAEVDPAGWHGVPPEACVDGVAVGRGAAELGEAIRPATFTEAFGVAMLEAAEADARVVAVTAAMAKGTGLAGFQACRPDRFFDVGIAEEHAVTFAAGLAAGGLRPVVAIYSTFMQRAVDQVLHDVAVPGLPVVFALDRSGAVPDDGETHQGIYDVQLFRSAPGLTMVAPASAVELDACLRFALESDGPTMLRYPKAACPAERPEYAEPLVPGRGVFLRRSEAASLLFVTSGVLGEEALLASDALALRGLAADVYHLRFWKPFDVEHFVGLAGGYRWLVAAEEGVLTGGFAAWLVSLAMERSSGLRATAIGFPERPFAQAGRAALLDAAGLSARGLTEAAALLAGLEGGIR